MYKTLQRTCPKVFVIVTIIILMGGNCLGQDLTTAETGPAVTERNIDGNIIAGSSRSFIREEERQSS